MRGENMDTIISALLSIITTTAALLITLNIVMQKPWAHKSPKEKAICICGAATNILCVIACVVLTFFASSIEC